MLSSAIVGAIALCGAASAAVAAPPPPGITPAPVLQRRDPAGELDPWVSVNEDPSATTFTPKWTTDGEGKSSLKDAAPSSLTGSVFSFTTLGEPTTTTGDPPNPTASNKKGTGAFSLCSGKDSSVSPFCRPRANSTLEPGNVYYLTWDPEHYASKLNESYALTVQVKQQNRTTNEWVFLSDFEHVQVPAKQGYFPLDVTDALLDGHDTNNITVTLQRRLNATIGDPDDVTAAYPLHVARFKFPAKAPSRINTPGALAIALPVVFGTILLLVVGLCLWNRKTRRIHLGDIIPRKGGRGGYSGRAERRRRMFGGAAATTDADHDIQLGNGFPDDGPAYRDAPAQQGGRGGRRDSLDSLAESPVHDSFQQQGTTGGRNAFRDEMDRQQHERGGL
ncbi:hypothetical protein ISF_00744 [Cordyceps fumosorosea ARSEF 2679]|uniref:Uncharacterized protein n=1 Tax=Cordyceps fumosorosea (strain ARSEF 2679) TaxID=1081104 RepID=A0A168EIE8_CORFA|nr:hypothetical protein ISF_00744 [Cordyceps fumosorosea ARSEF 2679]OAA73843.1 hypothetical protein ISF_00744 [Cordyceps fumosorosea ARSEF 2679]